MNWTHHIDPGFWAFSARTDNRLGRVSSFGSGFYSDWLDAGIHLTGNRGENEERFQLGYRIHKKLFDNYTLGFAYQPITDEKRYSFSGHFFDKALYLRIGYSTYTENWGVGGTWRVSDRINFHSSATEREGSWRVFGGLNVNFTTGQSVGGPAVRQTKPIEWLE